MANFLIGSDFKSNRFGSAGAVMIPDSIREQLPNRPPTTTLPGQLDESMPKPFVLKDFGNLLFSNPAQAFKEQPVATAVVAIILLKLLRVI